MRQAGRRVFGRIRELLGREVTLDFFSRPATQRPRSTPRRRERGVALIVVLATIAVVGSVAADFQYNARVDLQIAFNARDEVQAEYSALSAMRMRAMLLRNSRRLTEAFNMLQGMMGMDTSQGGGLPVGQMLEMIPVECGLLSAITKPAGGGAGDEAGAGGADADAEGFFPGECSATSKSEHSKISIAAFPVATQGEGAQAQALLYGLLSDPKLERFFQEDDASGSHAESPQALIGAIMDWTDKNRTQAINQVSDEDRLYEYLKDSYRAKNAPFDSVAELQLVHGVNDALYDVLKDRVTIYNTSPLIELGTADDFTILMGLCFVARSPSDCGTMLASPQVWGAMAQMRQLGGMAFMPMNLANLGIVINTLALPVDTTKLNQVFTDRNSTTWYTIDAEGQVGNARRRMRTVIQTLEGQFYYFRIE